MNEEALFISQAIVLIGLPYFLWHFKFVKNVVPLVVMQIIVGIILGPSVFGKLLPELQAEFFNKESLVFINGISWLALLCFGFLTGTHIDTEELSSKGRSFIFVSISSVLVPVLLGCVAAFGIFQIFPELAGSGATPLTFVLGLGISMAVTALPVLGAILIETGLIERPVGRLALGYATVNDGLLWAMVSVLLAVSHGGGQTEIIRIVVLALCYFVGMTVVIRPFIKYLVKSGIWKENSCENGQLVGMVIYFLFSALITQLIGIHYLLGAFIAGALLPQKVKHGVAGKMEQYVMVVLVPFFFMLTGLRMNFDVTNMGIWTIFIVATLTSGVGKFLGVYIPSRITGTSYREARLLGCLLQCNGLMGIVVLTLLLQGRIISETAFSGMILMCLVTTAATIPLTKMCFSGADPEEGSMNNFGHLSTAAESSN